MNECAPARDYHRFELKPNIEFQDLPHLPVKEYQQLPPAMRQLVVFLYLTEIVDYLLMR
jgi:hypothetical protein